MLYSQRYVLSVIFSALYSQRYLLRVIFSALCSQRYIISVLFSALSSKRYILSVIFSALSSSVIFSALCSRRCIISIIFSALYSQRSRAVHCIVFSALVSVAWRLSVALCYILHVCGALSQILITGECCIFSILFSIWLWVAWCCTLSAILALCRSLSVAFLCCCFP